jgi:hypothetical protein
VKQRKAHWYFITYSECALCFAHEEIRERRYGRRPVKWADRHEETTYACTSHFL